jgi:hypothetical protein
MILLGPVADCIIFLCLIPTTTTTWNKTIINMINETFKTVQQASYWMNIISGRGWLSALKKPFTCGKVEIFGDDISKPRPHSRQNDECITLTKYLKLFSSFSFIFPSPS